MKILIIEDEPQTAQVLKEIITGIKPDCEIVGILDSIDKTVKYLSVKENTPNLIFMDIQLADGVSFEIFSRVSVDCPVVFCTAYDQYTLQAFKSNGIEYILKPIKEDDIRSAFEKVDKLNLSFHTNEYIVSILKNRFPDQKNYRTSLIVQHKEGFIPVPVENIAFFFLLNEIVYVYCFDNKKYSVFKTMDEIESTLDPEQFYRISRQIILNRKAIKEIQPYMNRKVIVKTDLQTSERLIVSRLKVTSFMKWIEQP